MGADPASPPACRTPSGWASVVQTFLLPFEIAALILTVAIVAAVALTLRERRASAQDPARQVMVNARDRVRIVKMAAVRPEKPAAHGAAP